MIYLATSLLWLSLLGLSFTLACAHLGRPKRALAGLAFSLGCVLYATRLLYHYWL